MDEQLKIRVEKRLELTGIKKAYLAAQMGISKSQLSQTFAGTRKIKPEEETKLRVTLNL